MKREILVVDNIDGDILTVQNNKTLQIKYINKKDLSFDVNVRDVIIFENDFYKFDKKRTKKYKASITKLLKRLINKG